MAVRLHIPYRSLAGGELRGRSHVQFDKILSSLGPPPAPPRACGTLDFNWANNQLSGPFSGTDPNELFIVGLDALASTRVIAFYSSDFGETWAPVDDVYPALGTIGAMEARQDASGKILVAVQERFAGRVSFSMFDTTSKTWAVLNSEVIFSTGAADWYVSVDRRQDGSIAVFYDADPEFVGLFYARIAYKTSSDDGVTWSPVGVGANIGIFGLPFNYNLHRVVGGRAANTFNFFFDNGGNNLFMQTDSPGSGGLGAVVTVLTVINGPQGHGGRPVVYNDGGTPKFAIPEQLGVPHALSAVILGDTDPPTNLGEHGWIGGGLNVYENQNALDFVDGSLSVVAEVRNGFAPGDIDWCFYQSGGPGGWTPTDNSLFIGPDLPLIGNFGHCSGRTWKIEDETYVGMVINIGPLGNQNGFQLAKASLLPVPSSHETIADWVAACTH
jgi:hypothetical protein